MNTEAMPMLGEALVQICACSREDVDAALEIARTTGQRIGHVLISQNKITRNDLLHALGIQRKKIRIEKLSDLPAYNVLLTAPGGELGIERPDKRYALLGEDEDGRKRFFMIVDETAPPQTLGQDAFLKATTAGWKPACRIMAPPDVLALLYEKTTARQSRIEAGEESDMHRLFTQIGFEAYRRGASDIHISVVDGVATIFFRVNGILDVYSNMTVERATALCAAAYNTMTEAGSVRTGFNARALQDAVIQIEYPSIGMVRFRYSCMPLSPDGFDVTLRVIPLGVQMKRKGFVELGYSADQAETLDRMFGNSSGLILFAGTTGSGKSTSMAHALMGLAEANPGKKIRTVEEPVEYRIPGAYQTPVVRIAGDNSDFTNVLRQVLRSDPDIIMVGEIRDTATAQVTLQAVRSGHLCVSTLHAEGAPVCYDRLSDLGVPRGEMASVGLVAGLVYQKLVPLLCPRCKVPAEDVVKSTQADPLLRGVISRVRSVNNGSLANIFFKSASGCEHCVRGYVGRTVAAEILRPTPGMLDAIASKDSNALWRMWRATISEGHPNIMTGRTAFEHAMHKMRQGIVSPASVESEFRYLDEQPWKGIERSTSA